MSKKQEPSLSFGLSAEVDVVAEQDPLIGRTVRAGAVRIDRVLGVGGMGKVYDVFQVTLSRPAALKVISRAAGDAVWHRFLAEAKEVAKIQHPNVVQVFDFWKEIVDGQEYGFFLMEKVNGQLLELFVGHRGPVVVQTVIGIRKALSFPHALDLIKKIAAGLNALHIQGIIHRDMKPENILVDREKGEPRIIDLGIAKSSRDSMPEADRIKTRSNDVFGTSNTMAPEQAMAMMEQVRIPADTYALTVIFYFLLAGIYPFEDKVSIGPNDTAQMVFLRWQTVHLHNADAIKKGSEEILPTSISFLRPDVPVWVETFLRKGLAHDPDKRFQTVGAFLRELQQELAQTSEQASISQEMMRTQAPSMEEEIAGPTIPSYPRVKTILSWGGPTAPFRDERTWRRVGLGLGLAGVLALTAIAASLIKKPTPASYASRTDAQTPTTIVLPPPLSRTDAGTLTRASADVVSVPPVEPTVPVVHARERSTRSSPRARVRARPCEPHLNENGTFTPCL